MILASDWLAFHADRTPEKLAAIQARKDSLAKLAKAGNTLDSLRHTKNTQKDKKDNRHQHDQHGGSTQYQGHQIVYWCLASHSP